MREKDKALGEARTPPPARPKQARSRARTPINARPKRASLIARTPNPARSERDTALYGARNPLVRASHQRKRAAPKITETAEHRTIASYLQKIGLGGSAMMFHLRGERQGYNQRAVAARMGVVSKLPDFCVIHAGQAGFIELKPRGWRARTTKTGTFTQHEQAQLAMHRRLMMAGAWVEVCETLEEVQAALVRYGVPLRTESRRDERLRRSFAEVQP